MAKNDDIKEAFEDLVLKVLKDGEQVIVVDKETGDKTEVRAEPSAAFLGVVRAYLKDCPPVHVKPLQGALGGTLAKFQGKTLPFPSPNPAPKNQ